MTRLSYLLVVLVLPVPAWSRLRLHTQAALARNTTKELTINSTGQLAGNNVGYLASNRLHKQAALARNATKELAVNSTGQSASSNVEHVAGSSARQAPATPAYPVAAVAPAPVVYDTWGWTNGHGSTCADYATNAWCAGGTFVKGAEWAGARYAHHESCTWGEDCAQFYNDPASHCVACGKRTEVVDTWYATNAWG